MKLLALLLAAVGLSGCVAYPYGGPGPYYGSNAYYNGGYYGGYYGPGPYWAYPPSVIIEGRRDFHARPHDGRRFHGGDRDRDGIPNRIDRDRDGDGVPNRLDRRPWDPRRN